MSAPSVSGEVLDSKSNKAEVKSVTVETSTNSSSSSELVSKPPVRRGSSITPRFSKELTVPKPRLGFDLPTLSLIPILVSIAFVLNTLGFPALFILACMTIAALVVAYRDNLTLEFLVRLLSKTVVHVFFRELDSRNSHRIPTHGPVVFVCAPHANQFLDPAVMMEFVPRPVSFLIAAKSYRQGLIGALAKAQRSIPVERPQDLATVAPGKVTVAGTVVTGTGTTFTTTFGPTDSFLVNNEIIAIAKVESDTVLHLKQTHPKGDISSPVAYKRVPKLDQNEVFKHVWATLADGNCIGIFPEGGSHDRPDLLPLKAGVSIMALGAAANNPGLDVKIVAVGLNYFHGHRFRGRAYVEYGDPFSLPQELIETYRKGGPSKIEACNKLMDTIRDQLKAVTVSAPSWDQLQMLWAVRRLYQPTGIKLPPKVTVVLIRRFAESYDKVKNLPEVVELSKEVVEYNESLSDYGLRDHQVAVMQMSRVEAGLKLVHRIALLVLFALLALPGLVLNLPIIIITRAVSRRKQSEALKGSNVKIDGKDVLASWKVLTSLTLVPLMFVVYPTLAALLGWWCGWSPLKTWGNFAVLQPVMMWSCVRSVETWKQVARSVKPLYIIMTDVTGSAAEQLKITRNRLKTKVRALVNKLGPSLYGADFASLRVFGTEDDINALRQRKAARRAAATSSRFSSSSSSSSSSTSASGSSSRPSLTTSPSSMNVFEADDIIGGYDYAVEPSEEEEIEVELSPAQLQELSRIDVNASIPEAYKSALQSDALSDLSAGDSSIFSPILPTRTIAPVTTAKVSNE